jgi:hypothetical protein
MRLMHTDTWIIIIATTAYSSVCGLTRSDSYVHSYFRFLLYKCFDQCVFCSVKKRGANDVQCELRPFLLPFLTVQMFWSMCFLLSQKTCSQRCAVWITPLLTFVSYCTNVLINVFTFLYLPFFCIQCKKLYDVYVNYDTWLCNLLFCLFNNVEFSMLRLFFMFLMKLMFRMFMLYNEWVSEWKNQNARMCKWGKDWFGIPKIIILDV